MIAINLPNNLIFIRALILQNFELLRHENVNVLATALCYIDQAERSRCMQLPLLGDDLMLMINTVCNLLSLQHLTRKKRRQI